MKATVDNLLQSCPDLNSLLNFYDDIEKDYEELSQSDFGPKF